MSLICLHDTSDGTASRCLALIERHAPRLMRTGGGALIREVRTGRCHELTPATRRRILALRRAAKEFGAIAVAVGFSSTTVRRVCDAAGIGMAAPRVGRPVKVGPAEVDRMVSLRLQGWTLRRIAARLGCSVPTVENKLRERAAALQNSGPEVNPPTAIL